MEISILKDVGLTNGEIRVYIALLEIGKSTAGVITKKSKISPSKIYDVLNRLIEKGLVSYILEGKIRHFKAAPPENILDYIRRKEEYLETNKNKFKKILPELQSKVLVGENKFNAEIFEGNRGLMTVFEMSFNESKKGDTIYAFGYSKYASLLYDEYWKGFHKRCDKKGVFRKVIYEYETWHIKKREKRKLSQHKVMPKGIKTPTWVYVFSDKVATIIITEQQKVCFLIQNREVVESYLQYFNLLWKNADAV